MKDVQLSDAFDGDLPSDTEMVIHSIQSTASKQFGFVFQHQVYATLLNRSIVDEEFHTLRHDSKCYKFLQCDFTKSSSGSTFSNATLLIKTASYNNSISHFLSVNQSLEFTVNKDHILCTKFSKWLETTSQMSVFRHELLNKDLWIEDKTGTSAKKRKLSSSIDPVCLDEERTEICTSLTEAEIDRLIQVGFLHYRNNHSADNGSSAGWDGSSSSLHVNAQQASASSRDQELYWLSHPAVR